MLREYYYDKYSIVTNWNRDPRGATATRELNSDKTRLIDWFELGLWEEWYTIFDAGMDGATSYPVDTYYFDSWEPEGYRDFELVNEPVNGMPNYHYKLTNFVKGLSPNYRVYNGSRVVVEGGNRLKDYGEGWGAGWGGESWIQLTTDNVKELIPYTAYEHKSRGTLLEENLIKNETYPIDGIAGGFWWVRGKEYTIPAPELVSPKNGILINVKEGEVVPPLELKTKPRHYGENLKYHVRVRMGRDSDFINAEFVADTRMDTAGFEYKPGDSWLPFPSEGVSGGTEVRYNPPALDLDFGFYYWDATQFHPFWGYGASANPRLIIVVTDTDTLYYLVINGKPYRALDINLQESSNGEVGNIDVKLLNYS